jgi:hypothetical protein
LIALSLQEADGEYESLFNAIKALGPWSNRLDEVWMVESKLSARQIRDLLKPHLTSGDRLFTGQLDRTWSATGMPKTFTSWMQRRNFGQGA